MPRSILGSLVLLCVAACLDGGNGPFDLEVEIPEQAQGSFELLTGKQWEFRYDSPSGQTDTVSEKMAPLLENTRQAASGCPAFYAGYSALPKEYDSDGGIVRTSIFDFTIFGGKEKSPRSERFASELSILAFEFELLYAGGRFLYYLLGREKGREDEGIWHTESADLVNWKPLAKVSDSFPWSLTAAIAPGNHHVRLYLETEGEIETIISKKDNFTDFYDSGRVCIGASNAAEDGGDTSGRCDTDIGPIQFFSGDGSRLAALAPRDPNVTQNDAGVYVMTWDNRVPHIGPGHPFDATETSPTFGLAFSVDGLNWAVYSNEMTINGLQRPLDSSDRCTRSANGGIRHVVPVFLNSEQLRLYFSYKIVTLGGGSCITPATCSLGTAISN